GRLVRPGLGGLIKAACTCSYGRCARSVVRFECRDECIIALRATPDGASGATFLRQSLCRGGRLVRPGLGGLIKAACTCSYGRCARSVVRFECRDECIIALRATPDGASGATFLRQSLCRGGRLVRPGLGGLIKAACTCSSGGRARNVVRSECRDECIIALRANPDGASGATSLRQRLCRGGRLVRPGPGTDQGRAYAGLSGSGRS